MQLKKEAEKQAKLDERKFFHDVGVNSSDVYYHNDDKMERQRNSLRNQAREVATKLNEDHYSKI